MGRSLIIEYSRGLVCYKQRPSVSGNGLRRVGPTLTVSREHCNKQEEGSCLTRLLVVARGF